MTTAAGRTAGGAAAAPPGSWRLVAPALVVIAWGGNHFTPLLLLYRQVYGYSAVQVDLVFAFYVVGLVPGLLIAGPLSDRHGRRLVMLAGLALGIAGSAVLAAGGSSVVVLCGGRLIAGASVAAGMVVGTSWIKELSVAGGDPAAGARRAALSVSAGFGIGPGVAGVLAQWGPAPAVTPYLVHIVLSAAAVPVLLRASQPATPGQVRSLLGDLRVPRAARRRFRRVVLPMAPWVFAAPSLAFVLGPALLAGHAGPDRIAFATLLTVVTLACGTGVQPLLPWVARLARGRQAVLGLILVLIATVLLAVNDVLLEPGWTVLAAALFGTAYGICIVSGLTEVQAMAGPDDLAGLTGIYYCLTYAGFALPVVLSALAPVASFPVLLAIVAGTCLACAAVVAGSLGRVPAEAA
ncbi:MAG TPA: MFS transporter [Streptosporangiaceae bacterium]